MGKKRKTGYSEKFDTYTGKTLFEHLRRTEQAFIREMAFRFRLTFQEFRWIAEVARDLEMWGEPPLEAWWQAHAPRKESAGSGKDVFLAALREHVQALRRTPKRYPREVSPETPRRNMVVLAEASPEKNIFGKCPVASEKTLCCQLYTLDIVENCPFGCSYCTIQTFYKRHIVINTDIRKKLDALDPDPHRHYHIGTGQSSDSLALGNTHGLLDELCRFAAAHPEILLELKTKSARIAYFLERKIPENIVISWSLNPETIIRNEEHFTACLEARLAAARQVADRRIRVAFHFHPMIHYEGWKRDYTDIAGRIQRDFHPEEVAFISFGSVTLIKSVLRKIRRSGIRSKILQMEFVPDPHGKLTYPDDIKVLLFRTMYDAFSPWHGEVFFYLCMEKASIWERALGYVYPDNESFARAFRLGTQKKQT